MIRRYLAIWIKTAFRRSIGIADLWSSLIGAALAVYAHFSPASEETFKRLEWAVPMTAFALTVLARLIAAPYWIWKSQNDVIAAANEKANGLQVRLDAIAEDRSLAFDKITMNFHGQNVQGNQQQHWSVTRIAPDFENVGGNLLHYRITELWLEHEGMHRDIDVSADKGAFIQASARMSYGFDVDDFKLTKRPAVIVVGLTAEYDNCPSVKKRTTRRVIELKYTSFWPVQSTDRILEQSET